MENARVAVIAGGTRGIGLAVVAALARAWAPGDIVYLTARKPARRPQRASIGCRSTSLTARGPTGSRERWSTATAASTSPISTARSRQPRTRRLNATRGRVALHKQRRPHQTRELVPFAMIDSRHWRTLVIRRCCKYGSGVSTGERRETPDLSLTRNLC
jgi:NAD(P)-dependent dehydrogenase (short-subunit alcohol dehydrogenase family)